MRQINIFAVFMPIIEMLGVTAIAIVIYFGGAHVLDQSVSIGVLAAFIAYMRMFFRPIRDLAEKYNILQNAMASAERIFLLMDTRADTVFDPRTEQIPGPLKQIRLASVSLAYNAGEPVLERDRSDDRCRANHRHCRGYRFGQNVVGQPAGALLRAYHRIDQLQWHRLPADTAGDAQKTDRAGHAGPLSVHRYLAREYILWCQRPLLPTAAGNCP
jgi:hypothetical protein